MKHADCGGTLKRRSSGRYTCERCGSKLNLGQNPSAHVVSDRAKTIDEGSRRRYGARASDRRYI